MAIAGMTIWLGLGVELTSSRTGGANAGVGIGVPDELREGSKSPSECWPMREVV